MSYENWVKNSWLDKQSSDREEIGRLLAIADARLDDYRKAVKDIRQFVSTNNDQQSAAISKVALL